MAESPRILLVDDNEELPIFVAAALREFGIHLTNVTTATEGLAQLEKDPPDLVLLDFGLPDMDGFEFLDRMRKADLLESVPVLALTAWNTTADKVRGYEMGLTDYITKPVESLELRARIQVALRQKELEDELRVSNASLRAALERAESATHAKSRFLANLNHEVRTPLHGIYSMAGLLRKSTLTPDQAEAARVILSSAEVLDQVLGDILDFSALETGQLELDPVPFNLPDCLGGILDRLREKTGPAELTSQITLDPALPTWVVGDEKRLRQILGHLLDNAFKHSPSGGCIGFKAEVRPGTADPDETRLTFEVRDSGPGISDELRQRLFQPFTWEDASNSRQTGGLGLGLAVCRELADLMGGSLTASNHPDGGARFHLTANLPVSTRDALPDPAPPITQIAEANPLRILVVDDQSINRTILCRSLQMMGYEAAEADSGTRAVEQVADGTFDLVFMDVQMPDCDGLEATRRIRAGAAGTAEPARPVIIAVTANAGEGDRTASREAGMDDYLGKPFRLERLQELLQAWGHAIQAGHSSNAAPDPPAPAEKTVPVETKSALPLLNEKRLREVTGGDPGLIRDLLESYTDQTRAQFKELELGIRTANAGEVRRVPHACSGASAQCGVEALAAIMREMETTAAQGRLEGGDTRLKAARECFEQFQAHIQDWGSPGGAT